MKVENQKQINFDDYVETYEKEIQSSIGFTGQDHDFFIQVKANHIKEIIRKHFSDPSETNILDIGCGIGLIDHYLSSDFKNLYGVDVEERVVEKAKNLNKKVYYTLYDGTTLPFDNNKMDIVFTINVMHHVPPKKWLNFTKEMFRVVKNDGIVAVFEHNPLNPLTRLAVNKCEFDKDAVLLHKKKLRNLLSASGFKITNSNYILFLLSKTNSSAILKT